MAQQWKPGDKVKLASGGPEMTVKQQYKPAFRVSEIVICQWFDNDNNLQQGQFDPDSLVAVDAS